MRICLKNMMDLQEQSVLTQDTAHWHASVEQILRLLSQIRKNGQMCKFIILTFYSGSVGLSIFSLSKTRLMNFEQS